MRRIFIFNKESDAVDCKLVRSHPINGSVSSRWLSAPMPAAANPEGLAMDIDLKYWFGQIIKEQDISTSPRHSRGHVGSSHILRVFPSPGLSHRDGSVGVSDSSVAGRQVSRVVLAGLQSAMKVKIPGWLAGTLLYLQY